MKTQAAYLCGPRKVELREIDVADPGPGEVQVRTAANGICMLEVSYYTGAERRPDAFLAGHEGIGVVTKLGRDVKNVGEGDYVHCWQWAGVQNMGARALLKFDPPPQDPATYLAEPVSCACIALRTFSLTAGDRVLVLGAGFMGLLNVQALAHSPLSELVVADLKAHNLELARQYGATETIQIGTSEGDARLEALKATPFDLVVEAAGAEQALQAAAGLTRGGGRICIFSWHHKPRMLNFGEWHVKGLTVVNSSPGIARDHNIDYFHRAIRLLSNGTFDLSRLVTHRHPISQVREALELAAERPADYIKGVLTFEE
jgi:threonine dehydrogenase-like Zn-dependent dehydrogenase